MPGLVSFLTQALNNDVNAFFAKHGTNGRPHDAGSHLDDTRRSELTAFYAHAFGETVNDQGWIHPEIRPALVVAMPTSR